jgi:hypothetical protein
VDTFSGLTPVPQLPHEVVEGVAVAPVGAEGQVEAGEVEESSVVGLLLGAKVAPVQRNELGERDVAVGTGVPEASLQVHAAKERLFTDQALSERQHDAVVVS